MGFANLINCLIYDAIESMQKKPNAMSIKRLNVILVRYIRKVYSKKQLEEVSKIPYIQLHRTWAMSVRNYIRKQYIKDTGKELLIDFHISYADYDDLVAKAIVEVLTEYNKDYEKMSNDKTIIVHDIIKNKTRCI